MKKNILLSNILFCPFYVLAQDALTPEKHENV
jgi:hypothetical protein